MRAADERRIRLPMTREEVLQAIEQWESDPTAALAFVRKHWWSADWGWDESDGTDEFKQPIRVYRISTGGWEGNEALIDAMRKNFVLWSMTWYSTRRGGHYEFRVAA